MRNYFHLLFFFLFDLISPAGPIFFLFPPALSPAELGVPHNMFRVGLKWRCHVVSSATCTATTEGWQASSLVERARGRRSTRGTARLAALAPAARGWGRRQPPEAIGGGGWDPPSADPRYGECYIYGAQWDVFIHLIFMYSKRNSHKHLLR